MTSPTNFARALNAHPYYLDRLADPQELKFEFGDPEAAAKVGHAHSRFAAGEKAQAVEEMNAILKLELRSHDRVCALLMLSRYLLESHDLDRAMLAAKMAVGMDGTNAAHWEYLAGLAVRQRDLDKALQYFQRSVALDASRGFSWAAIALMHALNDRLADVTEPARRAMALKKDIGPRLVAISAAFAAIAEGDSTGGLLDLSAWRAPPFDDTFLDCLPQLQGMPLHIDNPRGDSIVFAACDSAYLQRYAIPFVWSLERLAKALTIHLHVYNPNAEAIALFERLRGKLRHVILRTSEETVDTEKYGWGGVYFSCARFCRAYQLLRANGLPVVAVDVDAIFRKPVNELPGMLARDVDVGVVWQEGSPPWERVAGTCVVFLPTERSQEYARLVAALVARNLGSGKGLWFLDQICLYLGIRALEGRLRIYRDEHRISCDTRLGENAVIWTVTVQKNLDDPFNRSSAALMAEFEAAP